MKADELKAKIKLLIESGREDFEYDNKKEHSKLMPPNPGYELFVKLILQQVIDELNTKMGI